MLCVNVLKVKFLVYLFAFMYKHTNRTNPVIGAMIASDHHLVARIVIANEILFETGCFPSHRTAMTRMANQNSCGEY